MAGDDLGLHANGVQIGAQPQTQRLDAQQVDLLAEQPARIIFAKAIGRHQRQIFIVRGIGHKVGTGLDHKVPGVKRAPVLAGVRPYLNPRCSAPWRT